MKEKYNILGTIGVLLYVVYTLFNRFVRTVPDIIGIPLILIAIALVVVSVVKTGRIWGGNKRKR